MKKFLIGLVAVFALYLPFGIYRANKDKPHDIEIKNYKIGEEIDYGDISIAVEDYDFIQINKKKRKAYSLRVKYQVRNNTNKKLDSSKLMFAIQYRNGFRDSVVQNLKPGEDMPVNIDLDIYDHYYGDDDFIIEGNGSKEFYLYYSVLSEEDYRKYPSCLRMPSTAYSSKYKAKLDKGIFYYEIVEVGA